MDHYHKVSDQFFITSTSDPLSNSTTTAKASLTHNELLTIAFAAVRQGKLGLYEPFDLSVSSSENPIQMMLRHQKSGHIKVANIDRRDGTIEWDSGLFFWN